MTTVYSCIVLLVLYGDLAKRYLPPDVSLYFLYGIATTLLIALAIIGRRREGRGPLTVGGRVVGRSAKFLVAAYMAQALISLLTSGGMLGLIHAMYVSLPLAYVIVVQESCPQFDVRKLGAIFLCLIVPVNVVGVVQYFVDPMFLVSTEYSGPEGGVIMKTFLTGGTFARYPSIFASADRYSAMALAQFYFALLAVMPSARHSWRKFSWIGFNVVCGAFALLIAGARSRILIAGAAVALMAAATTVGLTRVGMKPVRMAFSIVSVVALLGGGAFLLARNTAPGRGGERGLFPVLALLEETAQVGEIRGRVEDGLDSTAVPGEVTLFGSGLGTIGVAGKPGEFGISSMWAESGLVWGSMLLLGFLGILGVLVGRTLRALVAAQPIEVMVCSVPLLLLVFSLLAGLTSAFELSSGILLGCCIGVIARSPASGGFPTRAHATAPARASNLLRARSW